MNNQSGNTAERPTASRSNSQSNMKRRHRKTRELQLADGRRILVALPEEAEVLRAKYARVQADGGQVEVVVHGSSEHQTYLQKSREEQQARREELRAQHGSAFLDEWDRLRSDLERVSGELAQLEDHSASLGHNFSKFGYSAKLRTTGGGGDEGEGQGESREDGEDGEEEGSTPMWHNRDGGEAMRLFQRPTVKQYFHRGLLWRASEQTEVQSFELFFDLLYVGIIAVNGDHAAESADGFELLRFIVTFCLSWKIWTDVTQIVSWFQTRDVVSRVQILFLFACLLAVTTNMVQTFGGSEGESESEEAGEVSDESADKSGDTYAALVAYYVTARLFMALYYAVTGLLAPLVRGTMLCQVLIAVVGAALWIASIHLTMPVRLACTFVALVFDLFSNALVVGAFRFARSHAQTSRVGAALLTRLFDFYPAINIEHKVERTNAFVTLVLGYSIVGLFFQNSHGYELHAFLGKAVLGLVQAFVCNWLYFDIDGANIHIHAIRRGAEAAWLWQYAHLLFTLAFVLSSAALSRLVVATDCRNAPLDALTETFQERAADTVSRGLRLYYSTGLGVALAALGLISLSHHHKVTGGRMGRLGKPLRLANRAAVAAVLCALPAAGDRLSSLQLVSLATGLLVWVLVVDLWGTSCRGASWIDWGTSDTCQYTARCNRRRLEQALRGKQDGQNGQNGQSGQSGQDIEQADIDINVLSQGEKHGAALMD